MSEIPQKLKDYLDMLSLVDDRSERIQLLIETAERFHSVDESISTRPFPEENKVPGCESQAYVWEEQIEDEKLKFHFAVENPQGISAKAMAVILDETLSGAPAKEVAEVPGDVIYEVFGKELSMGKSMGLMGMVGMVANKARKFSEGNG